MKKLINKIAICIAVGVISLTSIAFVGCGNKGGGEFRIAACGLLEPITFFDANNNLVGIESDLANVFAKGMNKKLKVDIMEPTAIFAAVASGTHDASIGWTITDARKQTYEMSDAFISTDYILVTKGGNTTLDGKNKEEIISILNTGSVKIGAGGGTAHQTMVENNMPNATLTLYTDVTAMLLALRNNQIDYFVFEFMISPTGYMLTKLFTENTDIKAVATPMQSSEAGVVIKKGNTSLLNKINEMIAKAKTDGTLDTILAKYA